MAKQKFKITHWHAYNKALMIDRIMPILINLHNGGQSLVENGIRLEQVLGRASFIAEINSELWRYLKDHLETALAKGWMG